MDKNAVETISWLTPQIILTMYASVISTIALLWNVVNAVIDRLSKIRIKITTALSVGAIAGEAIKGPVQLNLEAVNLSRHTKHVSKIALQLPYEVEFLGKKQRLFYIFDGRLEMPIELQREKEWSHSHTVYRGAEHLFKGSNRGKFRIVLIDTTGKKYKSNKLPVARLFEAYSHNCELSRETISIFNRA